MEGTEREDPWAVLDRARQRRELVPATLVRRVRHGWLVSIRGLPVVGYLPDTLLPKEVPSPGPGTQLPVRVLTLNARTGKVLVSHRHAVRPQALDAAALVPGRKVQGTVLRLDRRGALVDLGGVTGWLPVHLLRWGLPPTSATQVLSKRQLVEVVVQAVEQGRITVSLREAVPGPWDCVARRYPPGTSVEGRIAQFTAGKSAWVEVPDGLLGFIPSSWFPDGVRRTVSRGMRVLATVVEIHDPPRERLLLRPEKGQGV